MLEQCVCVISYDVESGERSVVHTLNGFYPVQRLAVHPCNLIAQRAVKSNTTDQMPSCRQDWKLKLSNLCPSTVVGSEAASAR
jgi:hypothetical protein